jgi:hypothetical protein
MADLYEDNSESYKVAAFIVSLIRLTPRDLSLYTYMHYLLDDGARVTRINQKLITHGV